VRKVLALVRVRWLVALSYRLDTFFSFVSLIVAIVPLYFVSHALQPIMTSAIHVEAPEYFGFLMIGIITYTFVQVSVSELHGALATEIGTGSFEALVATPTRLPALLAGMVGQAFTMNTIRALFLLTFAWALGAHVVWARGLAAAGVLVLIIMAYLPFGVFAAALVLAFRTTGPFPSAIIGISALMGGVYYPTTVIPSWLERVSVFVPLTYGLRSLRRALLDGAPIAASARDLAVLAGFAIVLSIASLAAFAGALRYARHAGTLAQY
jgi:ABC-2 type transport system permease protein